MPAYFDLDYDEEGDIIGLRFVRRGMEFGQTRVVGDLIIQTDPDGHILSLEIMHVSGPPRIPLK